VPDAHAQGREGAFERLTAQHPRTKNHHVRAGAVHDGAFDADGTRPAIEHQGRAVTERPHDMLSGGGAHLGEAVGTGGGDGHAGRLEERQCHGMIGHPDGDGIESGGGDVGHM